VPRFIAAAVLGSVVTFGLFYLMRSLIAMDDPGIGERRSGRVIDFVRLKLDESVNLKDRALPDKKPPDQPPPPPDMSFAKADKPTTDSEGFASDFGFDIDMGGGPSMVGAPTDGDEVPLVRIQPIYPMRAEERGIEGWVELEFTITAVGSVKDPKVVAYHPSTVFNQAAMRAIRRWKYNPKVEDGQPVENPGVRVRLTFELEKSRET
jgi:protein TonB